MRCASCGYESKVEGERFCEACGKPLSGSAASTPTSATSKPVTASTPTPSQSNSAEPAMDGGHMGNSKFGLERWRSLGWVVLAIILYLTIADAAVESFFRGSPLRWYIAGAAILYLGCCAALWRLKPMLWSRWSWANQAATSFLVLLALLTATAWLPGGLEKGLSLFGQPTSIVLSVLSAVVVAICGILLARLAFIPRAGKIAIGLVTAYGVVAFLLAVKFGTPYASLFHGGSVWTKLPFWLQGTVLGGLLVIPVALLLKLFTSVQRLTRSKLPVFIVEITALALSLAIMVAAIHEPTDLAIAATGEQPSDRHTPCNNPSALDTVAPGASGAQQLGGRLGGLFGATSTGSNAAPAEPCQRDAVASASGAADAQRTTVTGSSGDTDPKSDPVARLAEIQDSAPPPSLSDLTAAHQGAPAEQFAYVRDKIKLDVYAGAMRGALGSGIARAGNPTDKALLLAALLKRTGNTVRFARASIDGTDIGRLIDAARAVKVRPAGIDLSLFSGATIDAIVGVAPEQYRTKLRAQLAQASEIAKATLARADSQAQDIKRLLASAKVELGDEAKLRADASTALRDHVWVQLQIGDNWQDLDPSLPTLEPGQRLPTAKDIATSDDLPDNQQATLQARIVVTRLTNGAAVDTDLVTTTHHVVDLLTLPLTVDVMPASNVAAKDLGTAKRFRARIYAADEVTESDPFEIGGSKEGALLALKLKLTVKRPGFDANDYTRTIVDRRGPHGVILELTPDTSAVACALTSRFNGLVVTGNIASAEFLKRGLDEIIALKSAGSKATTGGRLEGDYPMTALHYFFREQALRSAVARFVVDRPNIVFERTQFACEAGQLTSSASLDIMENGQYAAAASAAIAALANIARGALDELIESDALGAESRVINTASIIAASDRAHAAIVMLRPGDPGPWKSLTMPAAVERAIRATLASGQIAAATRSPVPIGGIAHFAWWAVDSASGNTIGRVDDGGGQVMLEHAVETANQMLTLFNLMHFGFTIHACMWTYAESQLAGADEIAFACTSKALCELAVQVALDMTFSMFAQFDKSMEADAELANLIMSGGEKAAEFTGLDWLSVPKHYCGGD
jgi:hypothetical protein